MLVNFVMETNQKHSKRNKTSNNLISHSSKPTSRTPKTC